MIPNDPFFLVHIDKAAQREKRNTHFSIKQAWLGLHFIDTDNETGCLVRGCAPDSPAEKAVFNIGDRIVQVDETTIHKGEELLNFLSGCKPDQVISLRYFSKLDPSTPITKHVTLVGKDFSLLNHTTQVDMCFNLQYGEIIAAGEEAAAAFPEAACGDVLIFHHGVEYKPRSEGDLAYNDWHLVDIDPETGDEYRLVRHFSEVFGVLKNEDNGFRIIPHPDWVFCHPHVRRAQFQMKNGLYLPDNWKMTMDDMIAKQLELKMQLDEITRSTILSKKTTEQNYRRKEEIVKVIEGVRREQAALAKAMNQKELTEATVVFFHPATADVLGETLTAGDQVGMDLYGFYPLDLGPVKYALAKTSQIDYCIKSTK